MSIFYLKRKITLAAAVTGGLFLTACASQIGTSRYGDCAYPCEAEYQTSYVQTYYQVPVPQAPLPAPIPEPIPEPTPPPVIISPPTMSCPNQTIIHDDGTCLQIEQPVYIPEPTIGYTPDPVAPPPTYTPIRK